MNPPLLRELLVGYDRQVEQALQEEREAMTGAERVRLLHQLRRLLSVHDSVLSSALCPLLDDLPGGPAVADRLRKGCHERAELLIRFADLTRGVAAHNVYPVSGKEMEEIFTGLEESFERHEYDETAEVARVLEASSSSADPDAVAARLALEVHRAPTRTHRATTRHPDSVVLKAVYRYVDQFQNWSDRHHGWTR